MLNLTAQDIKGDSFLLSILRDVSFFDFFGDHIFRADLCNADIKLGDL